MYLFAVHAFLFSQLHGTIGHLVDSAIDIRTWNGNAMKAAISYDSICISWTTITVAIQWLGTEAAYLLIRKPAEGSRDEIDARWTGTVESSFGCIGVNFGIFF